MTEGPVVAISGAASGIGLVVARQFVAQGWRASVCDASQAAVEALAGSDPGLRGFTADIADADAVDAWFDDVEAAFGRLDALVSNAGIAGPTARVEDIDPADWRHTIDVDLNGHFYCARRAVPMLKQGGGSIVFTASNAAFFGFPLRAPYTACKWALVGLAKTLAMELGADGVRVNAVCPGSVSGPRIDGVIERDAAARGMSPAEIRGIYARQSSLRRFVDAEEVAGLICFLASEAGRGISGQAIGIDGHTEGLSNWLDD